MQCSSCQHENPTAARFCQECGARLRTACAGCGTELPPTAKFCHECGRTAGATPAVPAPAQTQEPRKALAGRYELKRLVGEGARKRVHLAWDTRLEREVALSLIKAEGLDEAGRQRVHREAQAMAQLGDHPNVGTVHDIGEEDGRIYIVSEFMAGGDLEHVLQEAGETRRLPPPEAIRIATDLCKALEHAHAQGVVHRDVKPGNVWVGRDGSVKLGDFGLAVSTDRSRITLEGMMVGTPAYMAPEQAMGRSPDARSDLYSLGATLYEMLTGRPPFLGDDAVAIISQHLHTPPVAPTWHSPEIPERLEALVLQLLEKDPERRPASASVVRELLATATSASAERTRPDEPSANPLDRLASGIFVGREEELETLRAGVDQSLGGKGRVLLLVGEPGIGKTRTSEELATYARLRGGQVLWGRCYEGDGAPPYWPWMQIIRAYVHEREPKVLATEMGTGAVDIAEIVSDVRERLPGLPESPKLDPDQARFRLFDSIATFLRNASRTTPLVVVLDDLHWADQPSLLLLQFVAQELRDSRILVVGTYRDVEVGRQHPLEQTLAELARTERADRVLLRGLTADDVGRFLELSAGSTPPNALLDAVYRETEGNPFFVHEVVRLLQSDGRLEHPEDVVSWSVEIPQGVRQVIGRRLDGLSDDCNSVLTVASVIGREFELRVLARASDGSEDETLELLEAAEDARIIAPAEGAPGSWRFAHALVRETLYGEVRTTRRIRLHRRIAEVLEDRYGDRVDAHVAELAYHLCEAAAGGDVAKAVDYAQRAARRALDAIAYEEAVSHFDRALGALEAAETPDEKLRCELLLAKGHALNCAGAGDASTRVFREAKAFAHAIESPIHVALALIGGDRGLMPASAGNAEYVKELDGAIANLEDGTEQASLRGRLHARRAGQLAWGDGGESRKSARIALELTEFAPQLEAVAEAEVMYSTLVLTAKPRERLERALALAERASGTRERGVEERAWNSAGQAASIVGDLELTNRAISRLVDLAGELRTPYACAFAARFQALRALREGRLDLARDRAWEARQHTLRGSESQATADQTFQAQLWGQRRLQGRLGETREALRVGVQTFPDAPIWRGLLACACAESGDLEGARKALDEARRNQYDALQRDSMGYGGVFGLISEACVALEDVPSAEEIYEMLLPYRDQHLQLTMIVPFGTAARLLGNLAVVLGRLDDAENHFEVAVDLDRQMNALGWLPRTQCDYARMLLVRSERGDLQKAFALLDEATATSQELGLRGWLDRCIETRFQAQGIDSESVSPTGSIDVLARSVGARNPDLSPHRAPNGTVTLVFSDIEGWTEMIERLGDYRAREVTRDHNRIVREQVAVFGGHEVEIQGDAFLLAFADSAAALRCAAALQRAFEIYGRSHAEPVRIRIGLHCGAALREGERFFGRNVVLAARVASEAGGAEILVSSALREAVSDPGDVSFGETRTVRLKGIAEPQEICAVDWRGGRA